jgi:tetratricopeptide (TPR) repeat protein
MSAMARLAGFFILVLVVLHVLRSLLHDVPVIGAVLGVPFVGFFLVAMLVSWAASKWAVWVVDRRKARALVRQIGAVDMPHNRGKLGSLLVAQGRFRQALPNLEEAAAGEPDVAEWHYRLGLAQLGLRRYDEALASFDAALVIDEEYAYGAAMMRSAEALTRQGNREDALTRLETFERNHGPSPESAYRRGVALKGLGRRDEARAAFDEVESLAAQAARYQKRAVGGWAWRARLARL